MWRIRAADGGREGDVEQQHIGGLVRRQREALGLSQTDLAARVGVKQNYVSRIERGEVALPQRALLERLGEVLGLTVADFYRAAGVLDGMDGGMPRPAFYEPDDTRAGYTPAEVAAIVAHVEARPGPVYRERMAAQRESLSRDEYEQFCVDVFEAWGKNADLALSVAERHRP